MKTLRWPQYMALSQAPACTYTVEGADQGVWRGQLDAMEGFAAVCVIVALRGSKASVRSFRNTSIFGSMR